MIEMLKSFNQDKRFKVVLLICDLSMKDLAEISGIKYNNLYAKINGIVRWKQVDKDKIMSAINVKLPYLKATDLFD